jgi:hypothetical protein
MVPRITKLHFDQGYIAGVEPNHYTYDLYFSLPLL